MEMKISKNSFIIIATNSNVNSIQTKKLKNKRHLIINKTI